MQSLTKATIAATLAWSSLSFGADALPKVAAGWKAELVVKAPAIAYPTAIVAAPDGTIYVGQDPMDMPGPATEPIDSVIGIKGGNITVFASGLWAVMGLEWIDDTLYVVHAPFLSAFKDTDGDGKADTRGDLMTGLGPKLPGFSGINDHVASGMRLGIDGFLYIAIGDKGIPHGVGKDGKTITLKGGGVIRIRPDGTGLEIVSTGERNPLSVALTKHDDVFTYGNDDDSKKWPNSLTHHIVGAHFGYPYEFLTAPWRTLPITAGQLGGSGTQGICYNDDGLPQRYRGNLFFCDWGLGAVNRYVIEPKGATFAVKMKETFVEAGDLKDFRPFSLCSSWDGRSFYLVDWGFTGWLAKGPKTGRIFRLTYVGEDKVEPAPRPKTYAISDLDHPSLTIRREAQRALAAKGDVAAPALTARLKGEGTIEGKIHAIWALNRVGSVDSNRAIITAFADADPQVRAQAVRASSRSGLPENNSGLTTLLTDSNPVVRREAAIALAKGDERASVDKLTSLMDRLGDPDSFVRWSVARAIRGVVGDDARLHTLLIKALLDPETAEAALAICDENWSKTVISALSEALAKSTDPVHRTRIVAGLAGLYRKYPAWTGAWFGTNPLAGTFPTKTVDWDPAAMDAIFKTLVRALSDSAPTVRTRAITALRDVGPTSKGALSDSLARETDSACQIALVESLGAFRSVESVPGLIRLTENAKNPIEVRAAALDALTKIPNRAAQNAILQSVFDSATPPLLIARLLGPLAQKGQLPANDLLGFVQHADPVVRASALLALSTSPRITTEVEASLVGALEDPAIEPRKAAIEAVAQRKLASATLKLIAMATGEDRSEALLALASMPDLRAADLFLDALADRDPRIRGVSESALMALRDQVGPRIETLAGSGKLDANAGSSVERLLARYQPVRAWKVVGPFARTTAPIIMDDPSIDFTLVHSGVEGRPIRWQDRPGEAITGRVVINDFKEGAGDKGGFGYDTNGSPDMASFGYGEFTSETDRPAWLRIGSSGSLLVSLNGVQVWTYNNFAGRGYDPQSDLVKVNLKRGINRVVLRSRQGIGIWQFSVQVSEPSSVSVVRGTKGMTPDELRTFAIGTAGDSKKGEALFFDPKGVGCVKCHAVAGQGKATIGPDLTGLALKYDKVEIIQSILEPSTRIATGYQPVIVATTDGKVYNGVVRSESDTVLELVDAEAKIFKLAKSSIEERRLGQVSVMPAGLGEGITPVEFADLVAYLVSLRVPAAAGH